MYGKVANSTYGKNNVKFLKVKRCKNNLQSHQVMECSVKVLLRGDFDASYTTGDNSMIIPTDTVKNTILIHARKYDTWPIEKFAANLALHFTSKYKQVSGLEIEIMQDRWVKYDIEKKENLHSFIHQGPEKRICFLDYEKKDGGNMYKLYGSIKDLSVLKSSGSMFYNYNICEYTSLKPTKDRILSTDIFATWNWDIQKLGTLESISSGKKDLMFDSVYQDVRDITLDIFGKENSVSVQATMFNMASAVLKKNSEINSVSYELPNKHYILFDFTWFNNLDNENELFYPSPDPSGLIKCRIERNEVKK